MKDLKSFIALVNYAAKEFGIEEAIIAIPSGGLLAEWDLWTIGMNDESREERKAETDRHLAMFAEFFNKHTPKMTESQFAPKSHAWSRPSVRDWWKG
jgi:hypothetical protein